VVMISRLQLKMNGMMIVVFFIGGIVPQVYFDNFPSVNYSK
jgi:hypothetical protein